MLPLIDRPFEGSVFALLDSSANIESGVPMLLFSLGRVSFVYTDSQ